jgi:hypothetical protein
MNKTWPGSQGRDRFEGRHSRKIENSVQKETIVQAIEKKIKKIRPSNDIGGNINIFISVDSII